MEKYLLMKFSNSQGETTQLKVDNIKEDLTDDIVKKSMENIATSFVLSGKKALTDKVKEAKIVEIKYTEFNIQ